MCGGNTSCGSPNKRHNEPDKQQIHTRSQMNSFCLKLACLETNNQKFSTIVITTNHLLSCPDYPKKLAQALPSLTQCLSFNGERLCRGTAMRCGGDRSDMPKVDKVAAARPKSTLLIKCRKPILGHLKRVRGASESCSRIDKCRMKARLPDSTMLLQQYSLHLHRTHN